MSKLEQLEVVMTQRQKEVKINPSYNIAGCSHLSV